MNVWEREIKSKQSWNFPSKKHGEEYKKMSHKKRSEEEEKGHNTGNKWFFPVSIFFVELQDLIDFLIAEGFFIDHISLRFKDNIGQGIKTYFAINPQVISDMINSNQIFDIEEILFTRFFEKIKIKIRLDSIMIINGSVSLVDNIKKFIRRF